MYNATSTLKAHTRHPGDRRAELYVEPFRPRRRRIIPFAIILVVVIALILSILTQSWGGTTSDGLRTASLGSIFWIGQALVSFVAVLSSVAQLSGFSVRDLASHRMATSRTEEFPFYVIRDLDELISYLFPDPTSPLLPDREIPFLPRISEEIDAAFQRSGRILVLGRRKTGKTREVVELLRRWWYTGPTVLLAKRHMALCPPFRVPESLPQRNVILLFDDIHHYCGDSEAVRRLDQTIAFFAGLSQDPSEVRVIATACQEPEFWSQLHYSETSTLWSSFEPVTLQPLAAKEAEQVIAQVSVLSGIEVKPTVATEIAGKNDGTVMNLILSFRGWLYEGVRRIGPAQIKEFQGSLLNTWRRRYEQLARVLPAAGPLYAAVGISQRLDLPLWPALIVDLATEMGLGRAYHLVSGWFYRVSQRFRARSRWLDWYRRSRSRRWGFVLIGLTGLLLFYILFYLFLHLLPIERQYKLMDAIAGQPGFRLVLLLPILLVLLPFLFQLVLQWYRLYRRRQTQKALDDLLEAEVPFHSRELHPYDGQFEGNGCSRAWSPATFAGEEEDRTFMRLVAPHVATMYLSWADRLYLAGEPGPAAALAQLACQLAPDDPQPPFLLGLLSQAAGDLRAAVAHLERSRKLNRTVTAGPALLRLAWCYYEQGKYGEAQNTAAEVVRRMPDLAGACWVLGLALLQQGQIEAGIDNCRRAVARGESAPSNVADALRAAAVADSSLPWVQEVSQLLSLPARIPATKRLRFGRPVRVALGIGAVVLLSLVLLLVAPSMIQLSNENAQVRLQVMNALLWLYPHSPSLLVQRSTAYAELSNYDQAIIDASEAIRLEPNYPYGYWIRGSLYHAQGDLDRALLDLFQALYLDPEFQVTYFELNALYIELDDWERAVADWSAAIRVNPNNKIAYAFRGWSYCRLGDYESGIADFSQAIQLDPNYAAGYSNRGWAYEQMDNWAQALADYSEAIRLDPGNAFYYFERGDAYDALSNYEQAVADYSESIRLDPEDSTVYNNRGFAYDELGNYGQAIADFSEAIRLSPDSAYLYNNRGHTYNTMGEYEQAIRDFSRAIQLDADYAAAYNARGLAHSGLSNYEQAIADYSEAILLNPDYGTGYYNRGNAYKDQGDYERALADYYEAIRLDPGYAAAYENRASVFMALGESAAARSNWERAIELYEAQGKAEDAERVRQLLLDKLLFTICLIDQ